MTDNDLKAQGFEQLVRAQTTIDKMGSQLQQAMGVIGQIANIVNAPENCTPEQLIEAVQKAVTGTEPKGDEQP